MRIPRAAIIAAAAGALLGGGLRIVTALLPPPADPGAAEALYLVIDLCILAGLIGFYASRWRVAPIAGTLFGLVAVCGDLIILGPEPGILGAANYQVGSALLIVGFGAMAAVFAMRRRAPWMIAVSLALALIGGAAGGQAGFAVAGLCFGTALLGTGVATLRRPAG